MRVTLIAHTHLNDCIVEDEVEIDVYAADLLAEQAGRLCYESWNKPNPDTAHNKGYLKNILTQGHFSVLEHATATFFVAGVSRALTHELIRHRHLSYSEVSQRYVDVSGWDVLQHPVLMAEEEEDDADWEEVDFEWNTEIYNDWFNFLQSRGHSRKVARGAARMALPSGLETKILVSGNHRAFREMIGKRNTPAADLEIRLMAQKMLVELKRVAPNTYQDMDVE